MGYLRSFVLSLLRKPAENLIVNQICQSLELPKDVLQLSLKCFLTLNEDSVLKFVKNISSGKEALISA